MQDRNITNNVNLLDYVKDLENRSNPVRGQQVQAALHQLGITPTLQESRHPQIKNIIADFCSDPTKQRLLFSAHYDAVKNSPGANDNASGVAVLLGLCRKLAGTEAPVTIVFFDREESWFRTPFLRLGLLGSLYYVAKTTLKNVSGVYNLEFCGIGDSLAVWPVRPSEGNLPVVKNLEKAAARLKLEYRTAHIPWPLLSSDHLSFRLRGLTNSVTLSLLPSAQLPVLETMVAHLSVPKLLLGKRPAIPGVLSTVHTVRDTSSQLSEESLQLMLSLLREVIRDYFAPASDSDFSVS